MKKLFVITTLLILAGCNSTNTPQKDSISSITGIQNIETLALGETCGGEIKKKCAPDLECQQNEYDISGICVKSVVNDIDCPKTQLPVCGLKGITKNGYLNECEARRHGAQILYDGFCKQDLTIPENCKAQMLAIGNCENIFTGYQFDGKTCEKVSKTACDADIPFETKELCLEKCNLDS